MDFSKILQLASAQSQKQTSSRYSTKISAAKKEQKERKGVLAKGVQAFLERQKKEEEQKSVEAKQRTSDLRDKRKELNTQKRANAMASRTKDNLKIYKKEEVDDADAPPVEYEKPIELSLERKRCSNQRGFLRPPPPKSPRLMPGSPNKILPSPAALMAAEKSEKGSPERKSSEQSIGKHSEHSISESSSKHKSSHSHSSHSSSKHKSSHSSESSSKHKSSHKTDTSKHKSSSSSHCASSKEPEKLVAKSKPKIKPRPRPAGPPPMSFAALLSMAQEKHKLPVDLKTKKVEPKKKPQHDRPMTQEEKEIAELKKTKEYQEWYKKGGERPKIFKRDDDYSDDSDEDEDEPPAKISRPSSGASVNNRSQDIRSQAMSNRVDNSGVRSQRVGSSGEKTSSALMRQPNTSGSSSRLNGGHRPENRNTERSKQPSVSAHGDGRTSSEKARLLANSSSKSDIRKTESRSIDHVNSSERKHSFGKAVKRPWDDSQEEPVSKNSPAASGPGLNKSKTTSQSSRQSLGKSPSGSSAFTKSKSQDMKPPPRTNGRPQMKSSVASSRSKQLDERVLQCGPPQKPTKENMNKKEVNKRDEKRKEALKDERKKEEIRRTQIKKADEKKKSENQVSTWDRIYGQIQKNKPKPEKRRPNVIDSEEEYYEGEDEFIDDEYDEDDDFIDDSDQPGDISSFIRDIFGYDKRKYRNEREDDLHDMEASYSAITREEARSAKIGLKEDLEDIRKEQEEKKQKMLRKKEIMKAIKSKRR